MVPAGEGESMREKTGSANNRIAVRIRRTISIALVLSMILCMMAPSAAYARKRRKKNKAFLNTTAVTIYVGKSVKLKVKKRGRRKVKWSSSNPGVASVAKGRVAGKSAGTAVITAKVGKKVLTCTVTVQNEEYFMDAAPAYTLLNQFRTTPGIAYWNQDNVTQTVFNTSAQNTLQPLARNEALEQTARVRVLELVQLFSHTRPDGSDCFTAYPQNMLPGENIAEGTYLSAASATNLWQEDKYDYSGQGHRRNMLDPEFTYVGIAGYYFNGFVYWIQCFGAEEKTLDEDASFSAEDDAEDSQSETAGSSQESDDDESDES